MPSANIPAVKDNAYGTLFTGINAATLSITLDSGDGARFPQPYNGTATSLGSSTTLNCTGISATIGGSTAVGKPIFNATDGSIAFIKSVAANAVTTTPLLGGSDNTWQNSDTWRIDEFIVTLEKIVTITLGVDRVTYQEEALIIGRNTDILTVATGGRGYNGTTANIFDAEDHVRLLVTSPNHQRIVDYLNELAKQEETDRTNIATNTTDIDNIESGASFYAAATGSANAYAITISPAPAAYAAGQFFHFKANFAVTGSATLNVNGQGVKTIKRLDGATNLIAGDIASGQLVTVVYDGTNFQMTSPPANVASNYVKTVYLSGASSAALSNPTVATKFNTHTYTIPANDLIAGVEYEFELTITYVHGTAGNRGFGLFLGGSEVLNVEMASQSGTVQATVRGRVTGTTSAGASAAVRLSLEGQSGATNGVSGSGYVSVNAATNGTLALEFSAYFATSNAGNSATLVSAKITKYSTTAF